LVRDEALVPGAARLLELVLTRPAAALVDDPPVRRRQRRVAEERPGFGRREVEVARAGPGRDEALVHLDGRTDALVQRVAVLRVADRELEHVGEPPRPELAKQEEPATERAGNARREDAGAGNQLVPECVEPFDRRGGGRDALPAQRK